MLLTSQKWQFKLTSVNDFPLGEGPVSPTGEFKQSLYSFYMYVTDSTLSDTNIARNGNVVFKLTSLNDFSLEEGPVSQAGEFK